MPDIPVFNNFDMNLNELRNALLEVLAADPGAVTDSRIYLNNTDGRVRIGVAGAHKTVAFLEDLNSLSEYQGPHDASTGIPTGTISAGFYWRVTVAGTIAGIGGNTDEVGVGDLIFADVDNPAAAADFYVIQANIDADDLLVTETVVVALLAGASVTATPATMTGGEITGVEILNAANKHIMVDYDHIAGPAIQLNSEIAEAGVQVICTGRK